jgi:hypothetical protein
VDVCKPLAGGGGRVLRRRPHVAVRRHSGAVQIDPIKRTLKPPGINRLKLNYDQLLSNFAFIFKLRRYSTERDDDARLFMAARDLTLPPHMQVTGQTLGVIKGHKALLFQGSLGVIHLSRRPFNCK